MTVELRAVRRIQRDWRELPVRSRLIVLRRARVALAERAEEFAHVLAERHQCAAALTAEVLPLVDACRFLERRAPGLLAPEKLGRRGLPLWLTGVRTEIRREPVGVVLVIGAHNYPLLLPGVQTLQALVAGNAVVLKPGAGGAPAARALANLLEDCGLPESLLTVLGEQPAQAQDALRAGVDKVLLTGSAGTGTAVLREAAETLTPAVMELSGCDAVFVRDDADLDLTARALRFGLTLNGGATCIAPRRVFVHRARAVELESRLATELAGVSVEVPEATRQRVDEVVADAERRGARRLTGAAQASQAMAPVVLADARPDMEVMRADVFAPLLSLIVVDDDAEAVEAASSCPYALGAAVFTADPPEELIACIDAGVVLVNDLIVPTADPRVPFGGRRASGFGTTRGADGLLELTRPKAVMTRAGKSRPHYEPATEAVGDAFAAYLLAMHGSGLRARLVAVTRMVRALRRVDSGRRRMESGVPPNQKLRELQS